MATVSFQIGGMSCGHCVMAVKKALKEIPGVGEFQVDIGKATVSFDPARASVDQLKAAVQEAGYDVLAVQ